MSCIVVLFVFLVFFVYDLFCCLFILFPSILFVFVCCDLFCYICLKLFCILFSCLICFVLMFVFSFKSCLIVSWFVLIRLLFQLVCLCGLFCFVSSFFSLLGFVSLSKFCYFCIYVPF